MKFLKPKFWENKTNILAILLIPFSILFYLIVNLKKYFISPKRFNIPVICVGNIYVGGTGKTPLSIEIANDLKLKKRNPVIIKKYYKSHKDEQMLINEITDSVILNKNRPQAIEEAERKNFDIAILDDGFQDYAIEKNFNIICFNSNQLIGNGLIFPAGPLRESFSSLKRAQIVMINGEKNKMFEEKILQISKRIKIFYSKYVPVNLDQFKNKKLFAFAGIGNPENFFKLISENNLNVQKKKIFPDHFDLAADDIKKMIDVAKKNDFELITTEKDFYRIKDYGFNEIKYLKVDLIIEEKNKFINEIISHL